MHKASQTLPNPTEPHGLWDKKTTARFLRVSVFTLDQWVSGRRFSGLRHIKVGSLVRFKPADVHAFVESCARGGVVSPGSN